MIIQTDHLILAWRPDQVIVNTHTHKEREPNSGLGFSGWSQDKTEVSLGAPFIWPCATSKQKA